MTYRRHPITLAIHPSSRGFGWAAFEGPFSPYDWGTVGARSPGKNEKCLARVEKLLKRFSPETVVLEEFDGPGSRRSERVKRLCRGIVALAIAQGSDVSIQRFKDVQRCFSHLGARDRWEIAHAIARQFTLFESFLPARRRAWEAEHWHTPVICAVALILTQYQRIARYFEHLGQTDDRE